ncbi:TPA: ribonuclease HII [Candidatus Nomurabacteria bacterium]|uniref:Ribonuclease n=1 Tax=Candidatus Nomurabacteria bacterium GW2011_GWE1_35_16 TaxID=1618761 RepID=A0A0G0DV78_9BACT|nr:MAG: Ribonuclease HII [Candidatus Nomurabacteria bacterium GW2011_GWF1_34_20]KKP63718.1 MAG: Ribonuclease HII [Candidatus Nomurabacteria bacterium GW2011_GWE2_34_25]KKP66930.1 MAG: Ribonuclease HII [Candidatus Nomurabacteria bacterium GW2011_GWE1_35_16]HAE36755.1 ribonuclease HII [Candidatus Nomurabacteria bacterium]HAX65542.1 ribonuclease HII [Candidatus Nomurabacteria bacterium]
MANKDTIKYIIGIDEVGRGPLAGPVAVCAFLIKDRKFLDEQFAIGLAYGKLPKLKDSKKLSKKQREEWFEYLKVAKAEGFCDYSVSFVSPENIDKFGIAKCIQKALNESLQKVTSQDSSNSSRFTLKGSDAAQNFKNLASFGVYLDGGLHAPAQYVNQETIIRGDELHPVISLASIVAKVTRDAVMTKYAKEYPEYGFERHAGYGTKAHYEAIKTHGQTPIHRKTFIH